ncbi:nacrein-like protein [Saccostrea cucullata]|uniref:nacrein-like protein n=1 Tax=Saccostrea cuccullata TaxID=36930 RepID=UPI002ED1CE48
MTGLVLLVVCGFLGNAYGVGYLGKRPPTQGACYYDNIYAAHFSYKGGACEGPYDWCRISKCWSTCGSYKRQSPINIDTYRAKQNHHGYVQIKNFNKKVPAYIYNNGHSPSFEVKLDYYKRGDKIILTNVPGRPKYKEYVFAQLEMHAGQDEYRGSEHSIDDYFYPMEAQLVFYDSKYSNLNHALSYPDSLVVMAVMVEVSRGYYQPSNDHNDDDGDDDDDELGWGKRITRGKDGFLGRNYYKGYGKCRFQYARSLSYLMENYFTKIRKHYPLGHKHFSDYRPKDLRCGLKPGHDYIQRHCYRRNTYYDHRHHVNYGISPADVLPYDQRFYTYAGSLTSPPCYETVQWIVYKCPVTVSRKAFQSLQYIEDSQGEPLYKLGVRRQIQKNHGYIHVYSNY